MKDISEWKLHLKEIIIMKKWMLFTILFCGMFKGTFAQEQIKYEYCQANASTGYFSSNVRMDVEGRIPHDLSFFKYIKDEKGNNRKFASAADFINFMRDYEWEFVQFFPAEADHSRINILFKRPLKTRVQDINTPINSSQN